MARISADVQAALTGGGLMLAAGVMAWITAEPWLFPSLGPTAYLLACQPGQPSSRFYNTVAGHSVGVLAGILAVLVTGANATPSALGGQGPALARVLAAVLAVAGTILGDRLVRASHPPAAATTLLVALGGFKTTVRGAASIMAGVLIVALLGEVLKREWGRGGDTERDRGDERA